MEANLLAIDLGGTKIEIAVLNENSKILYSKYLATPDCPKAFFDLLEPYAVDLKNNYKLERAVAAVPGIWDSEKVLKQSINLPKYINYPVWNKLERNLGLDITLAYDIELAALGEAVYGAGKGFNSMLYLNLGTGFSGALYKDGALFKTNYSPTLRLDFLQYSNSKLSLWDKLALNLVNLSLILSPEIIVLGGGKAINNWEEYVLPAINKAQGYLKDKLCYKLEIKKKLLDNPALFGALED